MILIDSNEPRQIKHVAAEVKPLQFDACVVGEYRTYIIERKTVKDLYSSFHDGRIFEQLEEMSNYNEENRKVVKLVVTIGNFGELFKRFKMTYPQFFALQLTIASFGIGHIHLYNEKQYIEFLKYLDAKSHRPPRDYSAPYRKQKNVDERIRVLCGFDGIGAKTAEELLKKFGTLKEFFSAEEEILIEALGEKKGRRIHEVINSSYI